MNKYYKTSIGKCQVCNINGLRLYNYGLCIKCTAKLKEAKKNPLISEIIETIKLMIRDMAGLNHGITWEIGSLERKYESIKQYCQWRKYDLLQFFLDFVKREKKLVKVRLKTGHVIKTPFKTLDEGTMERNQRLMRELFLWKAYCTDLISRKGVKNRAVRSILVSQ